MIAIYDTDDYEDDHEKGYSERYILGALRFHDNYNELMFAFNTTWDFRSNGTRIGLVATCPALYREIDMWEESLSKNLTLKLEKDFKSQDVTFTAYNDFHARNFTMHIVNNSRGDEAMIVVIIILASLITAGFAIYIFILVKNRKKKRNDGERASLLTDAETTRHSIEPRAGEYLPPSSLPREDSDSDSDSSEEERPVKQAPP